MGERYDGTTGGQLGRAPRGHAMALPAWLVEGRTIEAVNDDLEAMADLFIGRGRIVAQHTVRLCLLMVWAIHSQLADPGELEADVRRLLSDMYEAPEIHAQLDALAAAMPSLFGGGRRG